MQNMDFTRNPVLDVFHSELVEGAWFSDIYELPILKRTDHKPMEAVPFHRARQAKMCIRDRDIAYENAQRNGIGKERYRVFTGDILEDGQTFPVQKDYDIVVSNIVADVVIALAKIVPQYIQKGGVWISSGIITQRLEAVKNALEENGFLVKRVDTTKDWAAVSAMSQG